jgi:hypothetical protein
MFVFEAFSPGSEIGSRDLVLDAALGESWFALFPEDRDGARMPPGLTAVVFMRAYSDILLPRPPGNVHGAQQFRIERLPEFGQTLTTSISCARKELKGERRWVTFASETRAADGGLLFAGLMTTLWAQ